MRTVYTLRVGINHIVLTCKKSDATFKEVYRFLYKFLFVWRLIHLLLLK